MSQNLNRRLLHHNMAIIGGFIAGYSLLNHAHLLATAQTTNMISFVMDLCGKNFGEALLRFGALICYILGTVFFVIITKKTNWNIMYISLGFDMVAIIILALLPENYCSIIAWYPVFFVMSLQWNAFPGSYGYASSTLFSSNNIKQATLSVTEYFVEKKELRNDEKLFRAGFFLTSILSFYFGVVCSYLTTQLWGCRSILFDGIFAISAFFLIKNDGKYAKQL